MKEEVSQEIDSSGSEQFKKNLPIPYIDLKEAKGDNFYAPTILGGTFISRDLGEKYRIMGDERFLNWKIKGKIEDKVNHSKTDGSHAAIFFSDEEMRTILERLDEEGKMDQAFRNLGKFKGSSHIARLLTHTNAPECFDFARSLVEVCADDGLDIKRDSSDEELSDIPWGDGLETSTFWSIAPYVFANLVEQGSSKREAIFQVIEWSKNREPGYNKEGDYPYIKLYISGEAFLLAKDGEHGTHKLADKIGNHVARNIFSQN